MFLLSHSFIIPFPHQQCLFYGVMVIHFQDTSGWTTPCATVRRYPRIQGWHCQVPGLLPNHPSHSTLGLETYGSGIHKKLSNFHLEWFGRPWSVMNRLGHPHLMWVYHLRSYQKPSFGEKNVEAFNVPGQSDIDHGRWQIKDWNIDMSTIFKMVIFSNGQSIISFQRHPVAL